MKKLVLLLSMLTLMGENSCNYSPEKAGKPVNSVTRGTFKTNDNEIIEFFIANDGFRMYWGCNNTLIPWKPKEGVFLINSDDGTQITAILVNSKDDQNSLTIALTELINKGYSAKAAFKMIFDTYNSGDIAPPQDTTTPGLRT